MPRPHHYPPHPDGKLRDGDQALTLAKTLTEFDGGTNPVTLATHAAALAETGNFEEAIRIASKALELANRVGGKRQAANLQAALAKYRSLQPLRSP